MDLKKLLPNSTIAFAIVFIDFAQSDQIILKNGDKAHGTLITQTNSYITWESDNFGVVKIPSDQVVLINQPKKTSLTIENELFKGTFGLSGTYLSGNEQRDDLELDIGLTLEKADSAHKASINYEALGQYNQSSIRNYGIDYGLDYSISDRWYWGNSIFYGRNDKRQIEQSVSVGTNFGYQFWKNQTGKLSTEIGLTWISDRLYSLITDDRLTWAWSGEFDKLLIKSVFLKYSHQLNVSIKDSENTQLNTDIGVIIPVTDKLDTKISWDWSFDNQPEQGNEKIDRKLKFGINYSL